MINKTRATIQIFWQETCRYPFYFLGLVIGVVGAVGARTYQPLIFKQLFDGLAKPETTGAALVHSVYLIAFFSLLNELFWRLATYVSVPIASNVMANLQTRCYNYLQSHSFNFFNNAFVGSLVTKVNRFSRSYEKIFDQLTWSLVPTAITVLIALIILFIRQPIMAVIVFVWAIFYLFINFRFIQHKLKYDVLSAETESENTAHLADTITNQINLKLFTATRREQLVHYQLAEKLKNARQKTWYLDTNLQTIQATLMTILEFGILYMAVQLWEQGQLTIGDFALIQAYLLQLFLYLWSVGKYLRKIYEALADAEEMTEILLTAHEVVDQPNATTLHISGGAIAFDQVEFRYLEQKNVLRDFSFTIEPGERVALVGPSGGGKSTIVKLLFRFFDIQDGEIRIDGQNIAQVTQESLRQAIALVPQEPILFHRSLLENIRYAKPDATEAQVIKAAKLAHCHEFINRLPDKYETFVGERGVKLSGGERQRVAIARAILKDAPILVLDEATSSLDSESEKYIQDALHTLMQNRTTIVIAHRLSTIMQMDRIIVIDNGQIVESGKHKELLKIKQGRYQRLWQIQAGNFSS